MDNKEDAMAKRNDLLSPADQKLFYDLHAKMIIGIELIKNKGNLDKVMASGINYLTVMQDTRSVIRDPALIDKVIKTGDIPGGRRGLSILRSWKGVKHDRFCIYRLTPDGTVFISEKGSVYLIKGLEQGYDDMKGSLPQWTECTLFPFGEAIVCDGLMTSTPKIKDPEVLNWLDEKYRDAVNNGRVYTFL